MNGFNSQHCQNKIPAGTAALAWAYLNNVKDEQAPAALVDVAKRTVVREPMLITRAGNFAEIQELNTLRKANQMMVKSSKCIEYFSSIENKIMM